MMPATDLRTRLLGIIETHRAGRVEEAIEGYREVLTRQPSQFDALRLLGAALLSVGRHQESLAMLERALQLRTNLSEVWALRGDALSHLQCGEEAASSYKRALALQPNAAGTWSSLGVRLHALGRYSDALASFERALVLEPRAAPLWVYQGNALNELGRFSDAVASYESALSLGAPRPAEIWHLRADAQRSLGCHQAALESCERALALEPDHELAASRRAILLAELGRLDEAFAAMREIVRRYPDNAGVQYNLGTLNLMTGRLAQGWEGYEWRKRVPELAPPPPLDGPVWDGVEALDGRTLLLVPEQGQGDTIQFCRFAPLMAQRGVTVKLIVPPALAPLLRSLPNTVQVSSASEPAPRFDLQCCLLSIPRALGTTLETIPSQVPYLSPPPDRLRAWRERLGPARKPRIGLACSGSPKHGNDRNRSIALRRFEVLSNLDADVHLLQNELRDEDLSWAARLRIHDHRGELRDFAETAALASCMDAVVSVDTAVAHLAGALNLPLLLLLPAVPDWRWMLERDDTPWYPSARLIRQPTPGDWQEPLQRVRDALRSRIG